MSSGNWFDELSKTLAGSRSRRDVLSGIGAALAAVVLPAGLVRSASAGPECVDYCKGKGLKGKALGQCIATCAQEGVPQAIQCGGSLCDPETEYCCNESCGICMPIGFGCIQIYCDG